MSSSTSRCTSRVPGALSRRSRVSSRSMAPPPRASTTASVLTRRTMVACSRSRKAGSPWRAKISAIAAPASASITLSTSTKCQPRRAATSGPTVDLPDPMKPVRTMRRVGEAGLVGLSEGKWILPVFANVSTPVVFAPVYEGRSFEAYPRTMTTAPAVISSPPVMVAGVSFSPSNSHAKTITSGTLSLSSGATREAGPSCRARK